MAILSPQGPLIAIYLEQMVTVDGSENGPPGMSKTL